jgi:alkylation response protein AidB-like acyl-CoA dehydrogenase
VSIARASRAGAAAFLALFACAAGAAELGRLFFSAEERARLDKLRRGDAVVEAAVGETAPSAAPALTGFVQRSDGRNTVWINGRPVGVVTPRSSPALDPRTVRAYSENGDSVKVERKPGR